MNSKAKQKSVVQVTRPTLFFSADPRTFNSFIYIKINPLCANIYQHPDLNYPYVANSCAQAYMDLNNFFYSAYLI